MSFFSLIYSNMQMEMYNACVWMQHNKAYIFHIKWSIKLIENVCSLVLFWNNFLFISKNSFHFFLWFLLFKLKCEAQLDNWHFRSGSLILICSQLLEIIYCAAETACFFSLASNFPNVNNWPNPWSPYGKLSIKMNIHSSQRIDKICFLSLAVGIRHWNLATFCTCGYKHTRTLTHCAPCMQANKHHP